VADGAVASRIRHVRLTTAISAAVLVVGATVGALAGGAVAALGVAIGVALVTASYIASTFALAWADSVAPRMVFGVGLGMYILKFSLFGVMLVAVSEAGWAGRVPMAWGIVVGVLAWTTSHVWWLARNAHPYVRHPYGSPAYGSQPAGDDQPIAVPDRPDALTDRTP
jgi:hypothetical protein